MTTGGPDVLILDGLNSVWRWRPAAGDTTGRGSLIKLNIPDNVRWGLGTRAMGTFVTNPQLGIYNLYVVVPSAAQILKYQPASDASSFPNAGQLNYLSVPLDVSNVDDMYVDGNIYLVDKGKVTQWELGQKVSNWAPDAPGVRGTDTKGDILLRPKGPVYTRLTADNPNKDQGNFYAYDGLNRRVVGFKKDGTFIGQYMVPPTLPWLSSVKGLFVTTGTGGTNPVLYWIESGNLMSSPLSPSSTPAGSASPGPGGSKAPGSPGASGPNPSSITAP
jgi:hypothetical protein